MLFHTLPLLRTEELLTKTHQVHDFKGDHIASTEDHDLFWTCFKEAAKEGSTSCQMRDGPKNSAAVVLDHYCSMSELGVIQIPIYGGQLNENIIGYYIKLRPSINQRLQVPFRANAFFQKRVKCMRKQEADLMPILQKN